MSGTEPTAARRDVITFAAPAKINLYLHVTGRRADGYHELDSLVAFAGVHDTVSVAPAASLSLTVDGPFAAGLDDGGGNLVLAAANALADRTGVSKGAAISLTKRLPVASGIGGGSADAAAALRALMALWSLDIAEPVLMEIGLGLGADVPICLAGHAAFVGGIGERLEPSPDLPEAGVVLVNPLQPLATPAVFKARTGPFSVAARFDRPPADAAELAAVLAERRNDLGAAAVSLCPAIGRVLEVLDACPGALLARMSGSGATCFALFDSVETASAQAGALASAHADWWVAAGRLLSDTRDR